MIHDKGIFLQVLGDGMTLFHNSENRGLLRVMGNHWDSVNDIIIQEYQEAQQISYITCSKDNTLRLWTTSLDAVEERQQAVDTDLKRIIYVDYEEQIGKSSVVGRISSLHEEDQVGVKCMDLSTARNQLAVGDMAGNIRVYQLDDTQTCQIKEVNFIEAHEAKVVALRYSTGYSSHFLASASADKMIHIFNADSDEYELLQSLDAHSTCIVDLQWAMVTVGIKNQHKMTQYEK